MFLIGPDSQRNKQWQEHTSSSTTEMKQQKEQESYVPYIMYITS